MSVARLLSIWLALVLIVPSTAAAQPFCAPRGEVLDHLHKKYGERPALRALNTNGYVVEMLVSDTRSWTVLLTRPDGISCIADAGDSFDWIDHDLAPDRPGNNT